MYFKKIEIFGFKSFADKTVLNFGPGITAIIGPNGCGKSNIFDAIRWVLGEQSVKELRGACMEDVIFNGTDKKPALGFAEVSLTFSNESKMLPVDYSEVTVTRRLFRSGESEYLMNKTPVRLKDIVELFMGTGIGAEAYSLVQQGKVDLVVSAKPEDRRVILDEASGITKYKTRKREALNKLKDAEGNFLRINDIVIEVKRQIASLERQANKARRYKGEFEKLKNIEIKFANYKLNDCEDQRLKVKEHIRDLKAEESKLMGEVEEFNMLIEHENGLMQEVEDRINEVRAESIKLEGQIDINNRQVGFNQERIENVNMTQQRISENKQQLIEQCRLQQEKVEEVRNLLAGLDESMQANNQLLNEKRDVLASIANTISSAQENIQREEERILDITSDQVRLKNRLTESMKGTQGSLARRRRLEMENNKVYGEKEEIDQRLKDIYQKSEATLQRIQEFNNKLDRQKQDLNDADSRLMSLEEVIGELDKKKLFLKSQKEFIEKLSVQYEDMPDPVVEGRLFVDRPPIGQHGGLIGKIKEILSVDSSTCEFVKTNFSGNPGKLYELICEMKYIELDPKQISEKIEGLNKEIAERIVRKEDVIVQLEDQKRIVSQTEFDIQEEEKTRSIYEAQKSDIMSESNKLTEELDLLQIELKETSETLIRLKGEEDELSTQLDKLNQGLNFSQIRIKENRQCIETKSREREETTVAIAQLETELASVDDKRRGHQENLKMFSESIDNNLVGIKKIDDEYNQLEHKKEHYRRDSELLEKKIIEFKERKTSHSGALHDHERNKDEIASKINGLRSNVAAYDDDIDNIRNNLHGKQLNEQEVIFKEKEIKDRLLQSYKIDLDAVNREMSSQEGSTKEEEGSSEEYLDPEVTQIAIERLQKRCDSFGSVNLVAIEEFDELRERFEFLTKQQSDLISAKESLHHTIRNINRQTRQMFMNTFTKVSEEFRIYFRMLFGGGEARLVLLDPDNVLESGIEIIARPPGKKLQSISLLSGGEKTLTAIALIFGVFKVNPSPFCILDEIDAALDESNVGRYNYLLKDFAQISQFIVITHNKKTIESADVMYGITMQETGISKIVSVKLEEKEKNQEQQINNVPVSVS